MLWEDKLREWQSNEVTQALKANITEAIDELKHKIIYETDERKIAIMQGLVMSYLDTLSIIENGELTKEKEDE